VSERIRFAIVGTGKRSGYLYGPLLTTLSDDIELVGVWGRSEEKARARSSGSTRSSVLGIAVWGSSTGRASPTIPPCAGRRFRSQWTVKNTRAPRFWKSYENCLVR